MTDKPRARDLDTDELCDVKQAAESYMDFVFSEEYNEDRNEDYQNAIFEAVVEAYYGGLVWDRSINPRLEELEG